MNGHANVKHCVTPSTLPSEFGTHVANCARIYNGNPLKIKFECHVNQIVS